MTDAAFSALASLTEPSLLIMLAIGVLAGLVIGLIPGLGGTGAVAILLPVTFGMEPEQALAMLIGALAVVHTSDTVAAVLLGAPGSASASVTMLDGYSMARKGAPDAGSRPMSRMWTRLGWRRPERRANSLRERSAASSRPGSRIFSATVVDRSVSRARWTDPDEPRAISFSIL